MKPPRTSTTVLPQALKERLDAQSEETHKRDGSFRSKRRGPSRKEARQQSRQEKKQRKAAFFSSATPSSSGKERPLRRTREDQDAHAQEPARKKVKFEEPPPRIPSKSKGTRSLPSTSNASPVKKPKTTPLERLVAKSTAKTVKPRSKATTIELLDPLSRKEEAVEDAEIAWLEAKLGIRRGKEKGKSVYGAAFTEDGLDDLLMDLDKIDASPESDSDTDEAPLLLDPDEENSDASEDADEGSEDSEDGVEEDEDEDEDDSQADSQDGDETIKGTEEDGSGDDQLGHSDRSSRTEDLATPSASGAVKTSGSLYVPPHLRHAKTSETSDDVQVTEAQKKLSRQLQGLLNRLSEQNIESILGEIQSIYRKNPRNDVTTALTTLILNSISLRASILDTFVIQHAALVSGLHKITGVDFAAYFLQTLVKSYEQHHAALRSSSASAAEDGGEAPSEGKECMNLLVLLSELYNFQVISCVLAYDIIRDLLAGDLSEFDVELLLKMLRNSGSQLRQDDPLALKDIIQIVHAKVADKDPRSMSSRVRFMLETLSNLKNNKVKKNAGQNTGGDAVERLKKFVSGLSKKHQILAHEPLHVSLADLRSAGTKGKWWLVGSAWAGDPLAENKTAFDKTAYLGSSEKGEANALVKLARKQGMNTDVRRSIFVVLMSSDDYVDACERLGQLGLTELQQREIIRVILHCCGNEKVYNPYYTLVAQHLCNSSHSYKITLQYCLWDFLRDLGESDVGGADIVNQDNAKSFDIKSISPTRIQNLAKAYAWWVAKGSSSLTIFKPVDFVKLQPQTRVFFQTFFAQLFVSNQASTPALDFTSSGPEPPRNREALEAVMTKALHSSTLSRGIVYFLSRTALEDLAQSKEMKKLLKWGVEVATESLRMGMDVGGER